MFGCSDVLPQCFFSICWVDKSTHQSDNENLLGNNQDFDIFAPTGSPK